MSRANQLTTMILVLCLTAACSDDSVPADAGVDLPPGPDSCCTADLAPVVDLPPPGPDSCCAADVTPLGDLPPTSPDSCCAPDLTPATDLGGNKKLLIFAQCSTNPTCEPYCGAIGSKSEGWFDGCTHQLIKDPSTGSPYWDLCAKCVVLCDAIGSKSEGWYAQCP